MYYLETNSVRILSKKLHLPFYLKNCYTSLLTVCELLAGIKDEITFKQRKGIVRIIYSSRILCDNDLPETKRYKSYGITINNKTNEGIMLLGVLCITSTTYSELKREIAKNNLSEYWEFLKIYDNVDGRFKESYRKRQDTFDYSDPEMINDFKKRWDYLKDDPELKKNTLNDLIVYYAKTLLTDSVIDIGKRSLQDLISNYDHSIDIYFLCTGYFTGTKLIFKNAPSRNDYIDIAHLMYLRNPDDKIITNDKMLIKMMKKLFLDNIMTTDDFQK